MSYQIRSTPFLRRMVTTSKKNGELQKLKDEYDRIKEFNDRPIEMKMRQVRLKRLFREIEIIKETSASTIQMNKYRQMHNKIKTPEEQRMEKLVSSKELGKQFSKRNALIRSKTQPNETIRSNDLEKSFSFITRREQCMRRLSYGNEISRTNLIRISQSPRRNSAKIPVADKDFELKRDSLKQRNLYGNSQSRINMYKVVRPRKYKLDQSKIVTGFEFSERTMVPNGHLSDETIIPYKELAFFETFKKLKKLDANGYRESPQLNEIVLSEENIPTWSNLTHSSTSGDETASDENDAIDNRYQLPPALNMTSRSICNTNDSELELVPKSTNFSENSLFNTVEIPAITLQEKVRKMLKVFEPCVREAAHKEAIEYKEKLLNILNH